MIPIAHYLRVDSAPPMRTDDNFIRTFTGRKFWPLNPRAEDIDIADIAHSLSLVCRYTGHVNHFYSVADHSLLTSKLAERAILREGHTPAHIETAREVALWGLLHDASEAYLCDLPSPLKRTPHLGIAYKSVETALMRMIAQRFDLLPHEPSVVKDADRILLATEMRDLMGVAEGTEDEWQCGGWAKLVETIHPMSAQDAEQEFLRRFHALTLARWAARQVKAVR